MKIVIIAKAFPARSETFVVEHVTGLAERGHSVTVIAGPSGADITDEEIALVRRVATVVNSKPLVGGNFSRATKFVKKVIALDGISLQKKFAILKAVRSLGLKDRLNVINNLLPLVVSNCDVVHVHFGILAVPVLLLRERGLISAKMVVTWHGYDANQVPRQYGETVYHSLFLANAIHTVGSNFMATRLQMLGAPKSSIRQVGMGVDLDYFSVNAHKEITLSPLKILSVGRLVEVKGHAYLVQAIYQLVSRGVDVVLSIIGEGDCRAHLEKMIVELGIEDRVFLMGAKGRSSIRKSMWDSHIFALTGICTQSGSVESQGLAYAEAQACGLPVIASALGGVPESVLDKKSGILCDPLDVVAIASAIMHFVNDPEDIYRYGCAARKHVELEFSNQRMLDKFEKIYDEVLA